MKGWGLRNDQEKIEGARVVKYPTTREKEGVQRGRDSDCSWRLRGFRSGWRHLVTLEHKGKLHLSHGLLFY